MDTGVKADGEEREREGERKETNNKFKNQKTYIKETMG